MSKRRQRQAKQKALVRKEVAEARAAIEFGADATVEALTKVWADPTASMEEYAQLYERVQARQRAVEGG